jgi:diguanylate cyclase (GGDEF)-like protein
MCIAIIGSRLRAGATARRIAIQPPSADPFSDRPLPPIEHGSERHGAPAVSREPSEPTIRGRWAFGAALALPLATLIASTLGFVGIAEALEERETAAVATDLRLAAYRVATMDTVATSAPGGEADLPVGAPTFGSERLGAIIENLRTDQGRALHGLDPRTAIEAERLIDALIAHGEARLVGATDIGAPSEQHLLDIILVEVATQASDKAERSERLALAALLIAALLAVASATVLVRFRTKEVRLRESLHQQARTDLLTGLPNRQVLDQHLDDAADHVARHGGAAALLILDLDGFQNVNDRFGHQIGDKVLVDSARRLAAAGDECDQPLRLGADEFAIVLPAAQSAERAERAARHLLDAVGRPFEIEGRSERLGVSIGVAVADDPEGIANLAAEAELALQHAKQIGGNQVVVYEPALEAMVDTTSRMIQALRSADHEREFQLLYQPIFAADGTSVRSHEALLRWESPTLGPVSPNDFIPVAERCGEIEAIGAWVLEQVCRQVRAWDQAGLLTGLPVSVNVSPIELASPRFVGEFLGRLDRWQVPRDRIVVEITESALLDHGVAVERLLELRAGGVRIAIDDFGSGYSNIGQILRIPFDILKIDRSLLTALTSLRADSGNDPSGPCAVMSSVVAIAGVFGATVTCEGVDTEQQRQSLEASGVHLVQGFLLGRPAPPIGVDAGSPRLPSPGRNRPRRRPLPMS